MEQTKTCQRGDAGRSDRIDTAFSLLADGRRRRLFRELDEHDEDAIDFSELVSALARRDGESRKTIAVELHHAHLPKAAEAGLLEYDRRNRVVRYHGDEIVEAVLRE